MHRFKRTLSALLTAVLVGSAIAGADGWKGERTAAAEAAAPSGGKFDFGSDTSPVAPGYTRVSHTTLYDPTRGYGLDKTVNQRDRGTADPLLRDFVLASNYSFIVDLPNGEYEVKLIAGDDIASNRTDVAIEGVLHGTLSSASGEYAELKRTIVLNDGQMNFQFGRDGRINAIEVAPTNAPGGLTVAAAVYSLNPSISLTWSPVDAAAGYKLYRANEGDDDFALLGTTAVPAFTDQTAQLGFSYRYRATALMNRNIETVPSESLRVDVADRSVPAPAAPDGLVVESVTKTQLAFRWHAADRTLFYLVYRALSPEGPFRLIGTSTEPAFADHDVFTTVPYYYQAVGVNEGGLSERSAVLTVPAATILARQAETLNRSPVAVQTENGVYTGWRLFATDPETIAFNLYRDGQKLNEAPIAGSTNYMDVGGSLSAAYEVRAVVNGAEERQGETFGVWNENDLDVPLQKPADGVTPAGETYTYHANDVSVGDLDGDGAYELIVKWDPSNSKDNSLSGYTGNVYIDAYKLDGTLLWRIDLGRNIRAGAHYTQFMVYDLDGDGKAEIAFKTADGTIDGTGQMIGDPNADYRNASGYILSGPEYLTVFEGETGKALHTESYDPPRGSVSSWGDSYGNRVDRFLAAIAYLDGERPSLVMARGYYTRTVLVAYNWRDGQLTKLWKFDTNDPGNEPYTGQGNHNLSVGDVDGDGKDEIVYGAMAIDDDGSILYATGLGHGDAMHMSDLDPSRPGLEVFSVHEHYPSPAGFEFRDAKTGELIWGIPTHYDVGRGMAADIDPRHPGAEVWGSGEIGGVYSAKGEKISSSRPSINYGIWWDGDLLRELLDHSWNSSAGVGVGKIDKWDYENGRSVNLLTAAGTYSNNTTKGNPSLQADLFGDWREEAVWRTEDSSALRIYTTTDLTEHRIYTLMDDPNYRLAVAWQNTGYNQPPHPGFFLGEGMSKPPIPNLSRIPVRASAIEIAPSSSEIAVGDTLQLTARVLPAAATDKTVVWSVYAVDGHETAAASIDPNGMLRALLTGTVRVKAEAADGSGTAAEAVIGITAPGGPAAGTPGTAILSHDNGHDTGLMDGDYTITMNLWHGHNGSFYKLYENGTLIEAKTVVDRSPEAQTTTTRITGKSNGTYRYTCELINRHGTTACQPTTVEVRHAAPSKPVLSHNNWDGDGSFEVTMNLWWGTNGTLYNLYENGTLIDSQPLTSASPRTQSAATVLRDKAPGSYRYYAELVNSAGATRSDTIIVNVNR